MSMFIAPFIVPLSSLAIITLLVHSDLTAAHSGDCIKWPFGCDNKNSLYSSILSLMYVFKTASP